MPLSSLWDGLGYRWRNGDGRVVLGAHHAVDALRGTRPTSLVSCTADGELTIGCQGPAGSVGLTLPFLEERREPHAGPPSNGPPVPRATRAPRICWWSRAPLPGRDGSRAVTRC